MANILIIDDDPDVGKYTSKCLRDAGHDVNWIQNEYWEQAEGEVESLIKANPSLTWDHLILDIAYNGDHFGGFWLFNSLVRKGLRPKWGAREIIFTSHMHEVSDLSQAVSGPAFNVRIFMDSAGIPFENAMSNNSFDRASLIAKIEAL